MRVLSLFSGIGGFDLGFRAAGLTTIQFCEIDPYCRDVLAHHFPGVPIHGDIRTLAETHADVVCGGPPCQPASLAGERRGAGDDRWLWPEFLEAVATSNCRWVVAENPIGLASLRPHGLEWVIGSLEKMGFEVLPTVIGADDVGAPHRRTRIFIVAYADRQRFAAPGPGVGRWETQAWGSYRLVRAGRDGLFPAPGVYRMADGLPNWVDRTSALGNAVVPRIAEIIGRAIVAVERALPGRKTEQL
jgi:DNA (cytosine-5)-methyltransferase 1